MVKIAFPSRAKLRRAQSRPCKGLEYDQGQKGTVCNSELRLPGVAMLSGGLPYKQRGYTRCRLLYPTLIASRWSQLCVSPL